MLDFLPFYIQSNISIFQLLLSLILAASVAYFFYRKTVPPISLNRRIFLGLLRGISIFLILILIFAPDLTFVWKENFRQKIILAIDRSASMRLEDRFESARKIANQIDQELKSAYHVKMVYFDTDTISATESDSIDVSNSATDISGSLSKILRKEKDVAAVCLLSDGNVTSGSNPLFSDYLRNWPVFSIGFGDSLEKQDIYINNVKANRIVYKDKEFPINVEIAGVEMDNYTANIKLKKNGRILAAQSITIKGKQAIENVNFTVKPDETGILTYELEVTGPENEYIKENNVSRVSMESLKSKLNVSLIASQANYDVKFLKYLLDSGDDIELISSVFTPNGRNLGKNLNPGLDSADVLVLYDFPAKNIPADIYSYVTNKLQNGRMATLQVFSGKNLNALNEMNILADSEKIRFNADRTLQIQVQPTIQGYLDPVLNIFDTEEQNRTFWTKCPPLEYHVRNINMPDRYTTLLNIKTDNNDLPVLMRTQRGGIRNLVLIGEGFWRWHFQLSGNNVFNDGWKIVLQNMMRWLSQSAGSKNVILTATKKVFSVGDNTILNIQVYDAAANPVSDGNVRLEINGPTGIFEAEAENKGNGMYTWEFYPLEEGNYSITAFGMKNDIKTGQDNLKLVVNPVERELIYTRQDTDLLRKLAHMSGGKYVHPQNVDDIIRDFPFSTKSVTRSLTFELWNKIYILALILILLTVEWFLRKKSGLS